ncbi:hypothetical protein ABIA30_004269 [Mycobacterium sp. MAA66]|uniref:hypothetical protein n=1 Tax=Mycobacterium sp. MAA66 TaxID=3156297 RepID=UPI003518153C
MTATNEQTHRRWNQIARHFNGGLIPGRNDLPGCLSDAFDAGAFLSDSGQLDTQLLAVAVESTWTAAEYPEGQLDDHELWQIMFDRARDHLEVPTAPVTLYRGVRHEWAAAHMSWTGTLAVAQWFADRYSNSHGAGGRVYVLRGVEPAHVLARVTHGRGENGRGEDEYVLDPFYLDDAPIELHELRQPADQEN